MNRCHCKQCSNRDDWPEPDLQGMALQELENMTERAYEELGWDSDHTIDYMTDANLEVNDMHMLMDWICPECCINLMKSGMCPSCLADYSNFIGG